MLEMNNQNQNLILPHRFLVKFTQQLVYFKQSSSLKIQQSTRITQGKYDKN